MKNKSKRSGHRAKQNFKKAVRKAERLVRSILNHGGQGKEEMKPTETESRMTQRKREVNSMKKVVSNRLNRIEGGMISHHILHYICK